MSNIESMMVNPFAQNSDNPFKKRSQAEEIVEAIDDPLIFETKQVYDQRYSVSWDRIIKMVYDLKPMSPVQIEALLQIVKGGHDIKSGGETTGRFFSMLMGNSAQILGYHDFTLTTGECRFARLGRALPSGTSIKINGYAASKTGEHCKGCRFDIDGDAGNEIGYKSIGSRFVIRGNVGDNCGHQSENCSYVLTGDAGLDFCHYSERCSSFIKGSVDDGCGGYSKGCCFSTPNEETFKKMLTSVPESCFNKVILTDTLGNPLKEVSL